MLNSRSSVLDSQAAGFQRFVAERFAGQPVAMTEEALSSLLLEVSNPDASRFVGRWDRESRYQVTDDGVAVVLVAGVLVNRGAWLGPIWGMTSYEGLAEQFRRLAADRDVRQVVLDIHSGGGEAAGLWDLMPALDRLKEAKPVTAIANTAAYSAAYAIASAADRVVVARSGGVGSIGVIAQHMDVSEMLKRWGLKPTLITFGRKKASGNRYEPLSEESRADIQRSVDKLGHEFVAHVARYRRLDPQAVIATEAACFSDDEAVSRGLADAVMGFDELLDEMRSQRTARARAPQNPGGPRMTNNAGSSAASGDLSAQITAALADLAVKANQKAETGSNMVSKAEAERMAKDAATAAVAADRSRIFAILDHDEAKGREALARKLASTSDMTVDAAVETLKTAAKAEATQSKDGLTSALDRAMTAGANAAQVKPEATSADGSGVKRTSLADKVKSRFAKAS
ncbi:S49 family peptidase [Leptospira interrogans]